MSYIGKRTGLNDAKLLETARYCMNDNNDCEHCPFGVTVNNIDCTYAIMCDLYDLIMWHTSDERCER